MSIFGMIFLAMLASIGVGLMFLEMIRTRKAKTAEYTCICFDSALSDERLPDMVIICRNEAEKEEIIKRITESDERRAFIKRI